MDSVSNTFETKVDLARAAGAGNALVLQYVAEIEQYEDVFSEWYKVCDEIKSAYTDDKKGRKRGRYNVLWSNLENLKPSVLYNLPNVQSERRYKDKDQVAREAATLAERYTQFTIDKQRVFRQACLARDEYLLYARGVLWVKYVPHFEQFETQVEVVPNESGFFVTLDGQIVDPSEVEQDPVSGKYYYESMSEDLTHEVVDIDFIHRENFGHNVCRNYDEIKIGWKKLYLTRDQLIERFGEEKGQAVPLNYTPKQMRDKTDEEKSLFKKAEVYEIWDKETKKVTWICRDYKADYLDQKDDPLKLEDFFPFRIVYGTTDTDSLIPRPDYMMYKAIANELAKVNVRISSLTDAIKVKGLYPQVMKQIAELATGGPELSLIPVENWAAHANAGGLKGMIDWMPIQEIAQVLIHLYNAKDRLKQDLYEISGQSDILRGQTDPRETATAQRGKMQYASLRLNQKQKAYAEFFRDICGIVSEIIAEHFEDMSIYQIANVDSMGPDSQQLFPQAIALLRNNAARDFRISLETDSTIAQDEADAQQRAVEFTNAITQGLNDTLPIIQGVPEAAEMLTEVFSLMARQFKAGRAVDAAIERFGEAMKKKAMQPPAPQPQEGQEAPPPPPQADPRVMAEQIRAKSRQDQMQQEGYFKSQDLNLRAQKLQTEAAIEAAKLKQAHEESQARLMLEGMKEGYQQGLGG